ncbi:MAG: hypothetical protein IPN19_06040 [Elusimicrobia bacterium]|nr:hypothetical protein [Elusimicrobiota bacterium]
MPHQTETKHGFTYFVPGGAGGLAPALATGIFVDETETELGRSAAQFIWAQRQNGQLIGAPAWGLSPSESPDGKEFLAYSALTEDVAAPVGSGLAAIYYPRQSADNLCAEMEKNESALRGAVTAAGGRLGFATAGIGGPDGCRRFTAARTKR